MAVTTTHNTGKSMEIRATKTDFNRLFEENIGKFGTYKEAYEATEREHLQQCGARRYADYDSFRVSRERSLRK